MTHTAETARALVIGETLAVQVVAMRQQRIGGRAFMARPTFPTVHIDLNIRCSAHDSTTFAALEDVHGGAVAPGTVVFCVEPESQVRGLGVVKHVDHERGLVYLNLDFQSLHESVGA